MTTQTVAALCVRRDSIYKSIPNIDAWDIDRDAYQWPGGCPVVAHPPCAQWSMMRGFAKQHDRSKQLAPYCVDLVRRYGGVVDHPWGSLLWPYMQLPEPFQKKDKFGGWTLQVDQFAFGHKARKRTLLYIVGCGPALLPPIPKRNGRPEYLCCAPMRTRTRVKVCSPVEREATPEAFAHFLVAIALATKPRLSVPAIDELSGGLPCQVSKS